jgi:hypothetical protein
MTKLFTFFLLIALTLSSCSNGSLTEPEQIGKHVFGIMKTNSTIVKQAYIDNFLSIEEIRELGKNEEVVKKEDTRNEMTSMLKEEWIGRIASDYNQIIKKGASSGIDWQNIEYLDFVYEIEYDDGIKIAIGELYFKYDGKTYKFETDAIWNGEEYRIYKIDNLRLN